MPFLIIVLNWLILKKEREPGRFYVVGRSAGKNNKSEEYSLMD